MSCRETCRRSIAAAGAGNVEPMHLDIRGAHAVPSARRLGGGFVTRRRGPRVRVGTLSYEPCERRLTLDGRAALPSYDVGSPAFVDVWVDPVAGSDVAAGATRETALRTVTEAWRRIPVSVPLTTGVRINLAAGTYSTDDVPIYWERRLGTRDAPIVVRAADGAGTARLPTVNVFGCTHLRFDGLHISAGGGDVLHFEACTHVLLKDTTVQGLGAIATYAVPQETLKVNQCQHVYIERCDISGAWDNAIDFVAVQYGHVVGTRVHRAGDWAMYAKGGSAHLVIAGNEFFDAGTGGFTAGQGTGFEFMVAPWLRHEASHITFVDNVIHDVEGAGMGVNGGFEILMARNVLYRVGARSHVFEAVHGLRSCDGDVATCSRFLAAGGWGTSVPGREEPIPNENVFVVGNVVLNPDGHASRWQHLAVAAPRAPSPASNIPSPARADVGLFLRGNVIWNGPADHPLGVESPMLAADIRAHNAINTLRPRLVDPARGDYRLASDFVMPEIGDVPGMPALPPAGDGPSPEPADPPVMPVTPGPPAPLDPPVDPADPVPAAPRVNTVLLPAAGTYRAGQRIEIRLLFSEAVRVRGTPRLALVVGRVTRAAVYRAGSGGDTLTFTYTVTRRDRDLDGVSLASRIRMPRGAAIRGPSGLLQAAAFGAVDALDILVDGRPVTRRG